MHRPNADMLIVQETHSSKEYEQIWQNQWKGQVYYSHGTNSARGVAIFVKQDIVGEITNIYCDSEGRLVMIDYLENDTKITIVGIYAPNQDSPNFFRNVQLLLQQRSEMKIVIGDFNLVLDVELDRLNTYSNNNKAKEVLEDLMENYSLQDVWRVRNPDVKQYSWRKGGQRDVASRIDYSLVSAGLDQKVEMVSYISSVKTDHRAVYLVVEVSPNERGTGYWKLNTSLLVNSEYIDMINKEIQKTIETTHLKKSKERWEILKKRIKKVSLNFSKKMSSENKLIVANLSEKVNEYEANFPLNEDEDKIYIKTKEDLEDMIFEKVKGAIFRSKVRWYEEGEKSTKYFFSLEKARYNSKTCFKMINEEGNVLENQHLILESQKTYYQDLYSKDEDVLFNLENIYNISVPQNIKQDQSEQLSIQDYSQALKKMNNNKTPGSDGIPADFYKVFWSKISKLFCEMAEEVYEEKQMTTTAREGILNLIPKPNKDARYIKNLRPITLLNTDYKIIEKAVADKMIPALEHIINQDQRGFMKDRRISVNIRKMLDIIHEAKKEDLEAVVMSLDFVKCFDKCSFSILHGSLEFFDFGNIVKDWTYILYSDFRVKIQNNGNFSKYIDIMKGVHQGGCCSSVYFLVIAEILALSLRNNQDIEGITIRDIRNLLNQFADDMDIFSMSKEKSLKALCYELDEFRKQSGFMVSYEKTTIYRIGSLRHSNARLYNIDQFAWSNEDISVLGVTIAHENIHEKNYHPLIEKSRKVLNAWHNRGLSLLGKVQVINTLVASLFVYKMMVLSFMSKTFCKSMDNLFREFLWNGKKAKIALHVLQNPTSHGGLNLVNLPNKEIALKATWPQILTYEKDYSEVVYHNMRCTSIKEDIWRCSLGKEDVKDLGIKNQFWEDVLLSWCTYNIHQNTRVENQLLWYNSKIKIKHKVIMWRDVYQKGLRYVYQLFSDQKFKSDEQVRIEFGLTKMRYNSLKTAIPKEWKEFFIINPKETFFSNSSTQL